MLYIVIFFFSSRRRHTRYIGDWSSDVCSSDLGLQHELLQSAIQNLDVREQHIFIERRLKDDPVTLEELGQHYGISRERVRQLEARAFEKVQKAMTAEMSGREQAAEDAMVADAAFAG